MSVRRLFHNRPAIRRREAYGLYLRIIPILKQLRILLIRHEPPVNTDIRAQIRLETYVLFGRESEIYFLFGRHST